MIFCTPACRDWEFGQDPACNTVSVGNCRKYDCPTEKLGSCPPRGYSKNNPIQTIKEIGLGKRL